MATGWYGGGVRGLMILFVHEARHNEGYVHLCESVSVNDLTLLGGATLS